MERNPGTDLSLETGMTVGPENRRFRLEGRLDEGGMGEVWLALDTGETELSGRPVHKALKFPLPDLTRDPNHRKWLLKEVAQARDLQDPGIVCVWEWCEDAKLERPFIVMEYLDGRTLNRVLADEGSPGLPLDRVLALCGPIAQALDYAWKRHCLVHRDVKPGNVILTRDNAVKLLDFGISARLSTVSSSLGKTGQMAAAGTPAYRAPEASAKRAPAPALDVYSLGVLVYELLEGEPPFPGGRTREHLPDKPSGLDAARWEILKKAFAYDPETRFASTREFIETLKNPGKFVASEPATNAALWIGGVIVLIAVALMWALFGQGDKARSPQEAGEIVRAPASAGTTGGEASSNQRAAAEQQARLEAEREATRRLAEEVRLAEERRRQQAEAELRVEEERIAKERRDRELEEARHQLEMRRVQQEEQARKEDEQRRSAEESRKQQDEERRRERQTRLSQRIDYVSVSVAGANVNADRSLIVHLDMANESTSGAFAAFAFHAQNSDGIADFWKFMPQAEATAFDRCGTRYNLSQANGLGFARTKDDWTLVPPGQRASVTLMFSTLALVTDPPRGPACNNAGVTARFRVVTIQGGQSVAQSRALRFDNILE